MIHSYSVGMQSSKRSFMVRISSLAINRPLFSGFFPEIIWTINSIKILGLIGLALRYGEYNYAENS